MRPAALAGRRAGPAPLAPPPPTPRGGVDVMILLRVTAAPGSTEESCSGAVSISLWLRFWRLRVETQTQTQVDAAELALVAFLGIANVRQRLMGPVRPSPRGLKAPPDQVILLEKHARLQLAVLSFAVRSFIISLACLAANLVPGYEDSPDKAADAAEPRKKKNSASCPVSGDADTSGFIPPPLHRFTPP